MRRATFRPFCTLPLPIIVWAAVRFGAKGASGAVMVVSLVLIWRTLNGQVCSTSADARERMSSRCSLFLIGLSTPVLLLGAAIEETRHAGNSARASARSESRLLRRHRASDCGSTISQRALFGRPSYCRTLFGLPPDAPLSLDRLLSRIHPNDFKVASAAFKSAIMRATPLETEFRVQGIDDGIHWISARAQPVFGREWRTDGDDGRIR